MQIRSGFYYSLADSAGIALSLLCLVHCLLLPLLIPILPLVAVVDERTFHTAFGAGLIALAGITFWRGYRAHHRAGIVVLGMLGCALLLLAVSVPGHEHSGHLGIHPEDVFAERLLTSLGGIILMTAHWLNIRHCKCRPADIDCSCIG